MIHPVVHRKPDLSRLEARAIVVPKTLAQLEHVLIPWITEVVDHTRHPNTLRATPRWLVGSAEGKDAILEAPPSLADRRGNVQNVRAKFTFNGMADGNWYVASVKFEPILSAIQRKAAQAEEDDEEQQFRKRAEDAAKADNSLHPKALHFKIELHSDTWVADIKAGAAIVQNEIEMVHAFAKKAAAIPENPYGPKDMALTMLDSSIAGLGAMEERAEKLAKVYEKVREFQDQAEEGKEMVDQWNEAREEKEREARGEKDVLKESQRRVYEKSTGDVLAEKAIDLASKIPGGGRFVKGFAGMFFDFASANYAGLVTTIRGRAYSWYIAGFVESLTSVPISTTASDDLDKFFYNLGLKRGSMHENESFQAQIFLLWYTSTHYISGNLLGDAIEHPDEWTFPNGYLAFWSPERLGQAMVPLLKRKEYLVD
jgi:hypothetical protein